MGRLPLVRGIKKWVHIENMYPLLTLRLLFVHHLRLSDVAVSVKKSQTAPDPLALALLA